MVAGAPPIITLGRIVLATGALDRSVLAVPVGVKAMADLDDSATAKATAGAELAALDGGPSAWKPTGPWL